MESTSLIKSSWLYKNIRKQDNHVLFLEKSMGGRLFMLTNHR